MFSRETTLSSSRRDETRRDETRLQVWMLKKREFMVQICMAVCCSSWSLCHLRNFKQRFVIWHMFYIWTFAKDCYLVSNGRTCFISVFRIFLEALLCWKTYKGFLTGPSCVRIIINWGVKRSGMKLILFRKWFHNFHAFLECFVLYRHLLYMQLHCWYAI